ncbi:29045_t:CDS:2, partial [Gigaspora margarita]
MSVEALKNLCTCLSLSTKRNKTNLIERLTLASDLAQPQQNGLSESIEGEAFENVHSEKENNQERVLRYKSPSLSAADIKALLKEIKHLREDVNHITERVEVSNM